jgi:hypothetical protein
MNERAKRLSEEIRRLTPKEQADLMNELLALTCREPDPAVEEAWIGEPSVAWMPMSGEIRRRLRPKRSWSGWVPALPASHKSANLACGAGGN